LRLSIVLLLLVGLAACGGGGAKSANPTADKASADKISLKQSDFPSGWSSRPHKATPEETATLQQLTQCAGIPNMAAQVSATAQSPDFSQGQATTLVSSVTFVHTNADATNDLAAFQSGKASGCLKQMVDALFRQRLPASAPGNLEVRQLQFPTLKDGTAAYQASFTVNAAGTNIPLYADFVYFQAGRAIVTMAAYNSATPFDPKLEQDLAKKIASRA